MPCRAFTEVREFGAEVILVCDLEDSEHPGNHYDQFNGLYWTKPESDLHVISSLPDPRRYEALRVA